MTGFGFVAKPRGYVGYRADCGIVEAPLALESHQAALTDEMKSLRIDLAQLQDAIDDLRHIVNSEYGKIIDLPNPLSTEELKSAAD